MISEDGDLSFKIISFLFEFGEALAYLSELSLLASDVTLELLVILLFTVKLLLVVFKITAFLVEEVLRGAVLLTSLVDELVSLAGVLDGILPLQVQLVAFRVHTLELFGGLVKFYLGCLGLSDLLFELLGLAGDFDGELLDVEGELLNLGLVGTAVLLKS